MQSHSKHIEVISEQERQREKSIFHVSARWDYDRRRKN